MASIAARFAAWAQKRTGPPAAPAGGRGGLPFLTAQFPDGLIWVEAAFGADLTGSPDAYPWVDITADVRHAARLRMRVGRADYTSTAQSAWCQFDLDNTRGDYSAYNPNSSRYPNVKRNTPIRVRIDLGSGPSVVWQGYAAGWTPSWDTSANVANVTVVAGGVLRRLGQGTSALRSALYRALSSSSPLAYWSMEDGSSSTSFASSVAGVAALTPSQAVTFASNSSVAGSASLPDFGTVAASMTGTVPAGSSTSWRVEFVFEVPTTSALSDNPAILSFTTTGTSERYVIYAGPAGFGLSLTRYTAGVSTGYNASGAAPALADGLPRHVRMVGTTSGGTYGFTVYLNGVAVMSDSGLAGTLGALGAWTFNGGSISTPAGPVTEFSTFGHLAFFAPFAGSADTYQAFFGYAGETASTRLVRLFAELGLVLELVGTSSTAMGPQPIAGPVDIMRECETADGGVLFDGFGPGAGYICQSARYNLPASMTIDVAAGELSPPFAPADDDSRTRNDFTVDRSLGSSARYIDTDGPLGTDAVGAYDSSMTVNTETDTPLIHIAAWQVALGTVLGLRYPNLAQNLVAVPSKAQAWIQAIGPAFRADVVNIDTKATQHPPDDVSLVVEGWQMELDDQSVWNLTASCSQYAPWRVATVNGTDVVIGSSASSLTAGLDSTTTGAVNVTVATLWSTSGGDYPVDLNLGGERVTCTGVSGSSSPQAFTISARSVNGVVRSHPAGEPVDVWNPARVAR